MDLLGKRVAREQPLREHHGEAVDRRDLEAQAQVVDQVGQYRALVEEEHGPLGEFTDDRAQGRGGLVGGERVHGDAVALQHVPRQVDPVVAAIILRAILQVVDDLERGADRVRRSPDHGRVLAMNVEDEAAHGHGRETAIGDEVVPILIPVLPRVEAEGVEEFEGVRRRKAARGEFPLQRLSLTVGGPLAGQRVGEVVEKLDLALGRQLGVVGDVVARTHEIVESQDRAAILRVDQVGGDGKVLVLVPLARTRVRRAVEGCGHFRYPDWRNQPRASDSPSR